MITIKEEFVGCAKITRAIEIGGWQALGLWLAMKCYAAENLTDGFVPDEVIGKLRGAPKNPRKLLPALVECGALQPDGSRKSGLVDPHPHGWQLHKYEDHASSATEQELRREKARDRKRRQREQQARELEALRAGQERDSHAGQSRGTQGVTVTRDSHAGARPPAHVRERDPSPAQPSPAQPNPEREARTRDSFGDSFTPAGEVERQVFACWAAALMPSATFDAARASCLLERVRDGMTAQDGFDAVAGAMADEWINGTKDGKIKRQLRAVFGTADSYEGFREAGKALRERPSGTLRKVPTIAERIAADQAETAADRKARGLRPLGNDSEAVRDPAELDRILASVGGI